MKVQDNISDLYRKQVDELLDDQSGYDLLTQFDQKELDELWEEISTEMDIGEVWNGISFDLDKLMPVDYGSGMIVKSIAVVIIILMGISPVRKATIDSAAGQTDILIETAQMGQSAEQMIKSGWSDSNTGEQIKEYNLPVTGNSLTKGVSGTKLTPAESKSADLPQVTPISVSNGIASDLLAPSETDNLNLVISPDNVPVEKSGIPQAMFPGDFEKIRLPSKAGFDSLRTSHNFSTAGFSLPLIDKGRISLGVITSFKNTWLLNNETFDGLKSESLNSTEIVFFPDVGLSLNYSLSKTLLIQADGFFYSNTGQEYLEYIYGHYSRKKITLKYSTIALYVKYKFTGGAGFMNRSSINMLAGGYLSVLHYAHQKINANIENIESQYEKFDFGVRLGSEIELYLYDNLSVAPGIFLSLGMPNIYRGDSHIPGYLRRTYNGSAEVHLTFYYYFD